MSRSNETELGEARVRAKLRRAGYFLRKSRYRNPELRNAFPGYMIIHGDTNTVVAGACPREFSLTLEEADEFLSEK